MKIFVRKNKKQTVAIWLKYVVIAYLVASWGANGVIRPLHYFQYATIKKAALECISTEEGIVIKRPQTADAQVTGFLSFEVLHIKNNPGTLRLTVSCTDNAAKEAELKVWKGWNCVPLEQLYGQDGGWESLLVPNNTLKSEELRLGQVFLTNCRNMDLGKTVYLFLSFLFLAALWEGVWWIRKRYAE